MKDMSRSNKNRYLSGMDQGSTPAPIGSESTVTVVMTVLLLPSMTETDSE